MSASRPPLRAVAENRPPRPPGRGPGPAVLLIAVYAALFGGALWLLRGRAARTARPPAAEGSGGAGRSATAPLQRAALLEAAGLSPLARAEYFRRLSGDCCPCGCDLNLRDCLLSDQTCVKSPELASAALRELR